MNVSNFSQEFLSLETKVALELNVYLEKTSIKSELNIEPSADFFYLLELYIPKLLSHRYLEWEKESLDGFLLENAKKIDLETAELVGLCILISDQTVTPIFIRLTLNSTRNSIASYQVFLGEQGGGHLGISGPPCNSPHAEKLLKTVGARINSIRWSYTIASAVL